MVVPKSNRRGAGINFPASTERMGLPVRPFLYTLDQLATLLSMSQGNLMNQYIYFEGRTTGVRSVHLIAARNIAKPGEKAEWRVAERELIRWLKTKGFRVYEFGAVSD